MTTTDSAPTPELLSREQLDGDKQDPELSRYEDRLIDTAIAYYDRAARAEAALVAAQEAMRERCAVFARDYAEQEFCGTINFTDLYESIRALPIPAAKPEGE